MMDISNGTSSTTSRNLAKCSFGRPGSTKITSRVGLDCAIAKSSNVASRASRTSRYFSGVCDRRLSAKYFRIYPADAFHLRQVNLAFQLKADDVLVDVEQGLAHVFTSYAGHSETVPPLDMGQPR